MCLFNLLKEFRRRENANPAVVMNVVGKELEEGQDKFDVEMSGLWDNNKQVWSVLTKKLSHLTEADKREEIATLLSRYEMVFRDTPGRTTVLEHDVDVGGAPPIKQKPYRVNPQKAEAIRKELDFMLQHSPV